MKLSEFKAIVESDAVWIKEWCKPLRLGVNAATGSPVFVLWESEDKKYWSASLFLRGDKKNEKGEVWWCTEGFSDFDDLRLYRYRLNRMIERYRECAKTGVWEPLLIGAQSTPAPDSVSQISPAPTSPDPSAPAASE